MAIIIDEGVKISELSSVAAIDGTESLEVLQAGTSKKASVNQLSNSRTLISLRDLGSAIISQPIGITFGVVNVNVNLTSAQIRIIAMEKPIGATITGVKWAQYTQGNYTASNYNGVGLYKIVPGGSTLSLIASSTNDGDIWKAASGWASKAFSSPYTVVDGEAYYLALLYNSSAQVQVPQLPGISNAGTWMPGIDLPFSRVVRALFSGQTSMPATLDFTSGLTSSATNMYAALY